MAELMRPIQYDASNVLHFDNIQQHMAAEIAESINGDVERKILTIPQAREVLRFLLAQLEGK